MIHKTGIQYQIINKKINGSYVPDYDALIKEAPNKEIKAEWEKCKDLYEKTKNDDYPIGDFAFKLVLCAKQACGHYEILQHPFGSAYTDIDEILESIANENRNCTNCQCSF